MRKLLTIWLLAMASISLAQQKDCIIQTNLNGKNALLTQAFIDHSTRVFTADTKGRIDLSGIGAGEHVVTIFTPGYETMTMSFSCDQVSKRPLELHLTKLEQELAEIEIVEENQSASGMSYMKYIEVDGLYAAKKNEIVKPDDLPVNKSTNNSRQLFAKVAGVNVQETDAGGLQMGIGVRGLNPKRTTNFNTKQDGYDISADALGYPESYYTPPIEAVDRIELVRGAASLQYGTQFGGLLNFKMKRGSDAKPLALISRQTVGSYGHYGSFNSLSGSSGEWNYYGYYQHKEGNSWRPNSHYVSNGFYAQVGRNLGALWSIDLAFTHSFYNTKQPGGLTDKQFEDNPGKSYRDRNWFKVDWNVAAATLNGKLTENLSINSKTFVLHSSRAALGFLGNINRIDTGGKRDLILGEFNNIGNETRLIQRFNLQDNPGAVLVGSRIYQGDTRNRQGKATGFDGPDYTFASPRDLEGSDFRFPSQNAAVFAELLLPISACWYVTPGVRFEHIRTQSEGYYTEMNRHPLTGELLSRSKLEGEKTSIRNIALAGLGVAWRCRPQLEVYANGSQNYRAMNFSDLYVNNPNLVVADNMKDETGFTVDIGIKGKRLHEALVFDVSVFMMQYQDRIGEKLTTLENEEGIKRVVNYRDNISDARFIGVELFEELDIVKLLDANATWSFSWYNNLALVDARYVGTEVSAFSDKKVEHVPGINYKTGIGLCRDRLSGGVQFNYVSEQYTDATNADFFPDATVGLIPSFSVVDMSIGYSWKQLKLEGSINNVMDNIYFTRRATGYPGPGIIPAERRMFFMTLQVTI